MNYGKSAIHHEREKPKRESSKREDPKNAARCHFARDEKDSIEPSSPRDGGKTATRNRRKATGP